MGFDIAINLRTKMLLFFVAVLGMVQISNAQCSNLQGTDLSFGSGGGTKISTLSGCSGTFAVFTGGMPSWITNYSVNGNQVTITVAPNTGTARNYGIGITHNGGQYPSGGFNIYQAAGGPPPTCNASAQIGGTNFNGDGEEKTYPLTYSNCSQQYNFSFTDSGGGPLPSWVVITKDGKNEIKIRLNANTGTTTRSVTVIGTAIGNSDVTIGGQLTQNCNLRTWYRDKDGDGFAASKVTQCTSPTPSSYYTTNILPLGDCNDDVAALNPNTVWYADSDNDNFKDPNGSTQQGCTKPSGNWTRTPESSDDVCPQQAASAPYSTNGCDPDCSSGYLREYGTSSGPPASNYIPVEFSFSRHGGFDYAEIVFQNGTCSLPYNAYFENVPDWLTLTWETNNKVRIDCDPFNTGGETRTAPSMEVKVLNGTFVGNISVSQDGPPLSCSVDGNLSGTVSEHGEEKTYPLTYSNCSSQTTFDIKRSDGSALPNWISVTKNGPDEIKLLFTRNDTQSARSMTIVGYGNENSSLSIGGLVTQSCNLQTWYKDRDNDGWADFAVDECSRPTPNAWYKLTVDGMGDCDDEDPLLNPGTMWYADTDGDNYKDPNGASQQSCTEPSGNWTNNPQPIDDQCPEQYAASNDTNGCDSRCTEGYPIVYGSNNGPSPSGPTVADFVFTESGGTAAAEIFFPSGCSANYNLQFSDGFEDWATVTPDLYIPNKINIVVDEFVSENGNSSRATGSQVKVNGTVIGVISIQQTGPPVIPTCNVSVEVDGVVQPSGNDVNFGINAESKTIEILFDPTDHCTEEVFIVDPQTQGDLPFWLSTGIVLTNKFNFSVQSNNTGQVRTALIGIQNGDGEILHVFRVYQISCMDQAWYPDQDGDTLGDVTAVPRYGCDAPTDEQFVYVGNNNDLCPRVSGTPQNQGCPPGQVPENRNTVTSLSYDLNEQLKVGSKSYFDEIGKLEQTQAWDIKSDSIWASAILYEEFGRPALQSLSAPILGGSNFQFKKGFIKKDDNITDYDLVDFDGANKEEPLPVGDLDETPDGEDSATLGWYYSENNNREDYQDVTNYPFTKSIYSDLNPGGVLRSVGGNKINGEWPQAYTFSMKASEELAQGVAFGNTGYNSIEITKTVTRDVHGVENVIFTDSDGKLLAAARSGSAGATSTSMNVAIPEQGFVDVHIAEGIAGFSVSNASAVTVYDLLTEQPLSGGIGGLTNGFYRVAVNDLDSYVPESISVTYMVNYYDYSLNEYDEANRLIASYQPLGNTIAEKPVTSYTYNTLGQLIETTSPDEGTAQFKYRDDGQIRFSQNSKQKDPNGDGNFSDGEFSYTNYDTYGRPVESGVYKEGTITFANADNLLENVLEDITNDNDGLADSNCSEQTFTLYDQPDTSGLHAALNTEGIDPINYPFQKFVSGSVSKTYTVATGSSTTTWYSYDVYGRVEWMVQQIEGLGTKTIDYEYDPITGQVRMVYYQKTDASERLIHRYGYNEGDQLITVETSTDNRDFTLHANYTYYETGALKRTAMAPDAQGNPVQGIDYVYNLAGQLKSINHPDLSMGGLHGNDTNQDLFGMQLDYHSNDYKRNIPTIAPQTYGTDQLNGNIKGVRWKNDAVPAATSELMYAYEYDRNNWLLSADFDGDGSLGDGVDAIVTSKAIVENGETLDLEATESITLLPDSNGNGFYAKNGSDFSAKIVQGSGGGTIMDGDYDVSNLTYDANGNILSLKRNKGSDGTGNAMDNLSYAYKTKTNQLQQVVDGAGDVTNADDIGTQTDPANYVYNSIGQLIENRAEGIKYSYNANGFVTEIKRNTLTLVKFFYNERNHRVRKDTYMPDGVQVAKSDNYVRDASGSVMAIYTDKLLAEQPIYGNSRLGVAFNGSGNSKSYVYELTDHLGNVRATFSDSGSTESAADYYPFGMQMPGRILTSAYRYYYQGQEKDEETGKEAFETRLWDSSIGRWLTTDPARQFASPYMGLGNSPINGIDGDGAFWEELKNYIAGRGWNSNAALEYQANGGTLGEWTGNPFDGFRSAGSTVDGEFVGTAFNAVQDFNFKSENVSSFRVNAGLQASADILGIGVGANLFSTTIIEWNANKGWYYIWENVEGGTTYPRERRFQLLQFEAPVGLIGVVPVVAEGGFDITTLSGRINNVTAYGQIQATSLLQIGIEKELISDTAARMYSQHGLKVGGAAIIGVELKWQNKNSFDLPK